MKKTAITRILALMCAGVLMGAALVGCMQQVSTASDEQTAARQYMAQVNQQLDTLAEKLDGFNDAVSRNDVVSMRTQADAAFKVIDEIAAIEAPEAAAAVGADYVEGCMLLESALSDYIDLYTELESSGSAVDRSSYESRLAAIQAQYDEGIAKLEAADAAAPDLKESSEETSEQ